jgi:2-polyprenyl-3-methyl-5-hydroxy-6-metoxy-1,4-benzoquinol methylase
MSNYTENKLTDDENNAWNAVLRLIGEKETVLDIGCSSGNFGAELIKRKQCTVDGIDIDAKDVALAAKKLRKALVLNIERDPFGPLGSKYDTVLMMDVIEHLADPAAALRKITGLLKPGGKLVFSVPNMAHVSVRLDLLLGDLDYRDVGLLDDTHLHFYSEKTLLRVLREAGYAVDDWQSVTVTYPRQLLDLKLKEAGLTASPKFQKMIADTRGNVYQFVGLARPSKGAASKAGFPSENPHETHYKQIEAAIDGQNKEILRLHQEIKLKDQHVRNLEARLNRITGTKSYRLARASTKPLRKARDVVKKRKR